MTEYWFKPKRYGFGATPSNWKGWALTLGFAAIIIALGPILIPPVHAHEQPHPLAFMGASFVLLVLFCFITWRKTEGGWRWRWGDDDERR